MRPRTTAIILGISTLALIFAIFIATRPGTLLWSDEPTAIPSSITYILPP